MRFLWLFPILFLAACGGGPSAQVSTLPSTEQLNAEQELKYAKAKKPVNVTWDYLDESLAAFNLSCENCPPSFGHFLAQTTEPANDGKPKPSFVRYSDNCQGGLIAENQFLTSRHCLPEDLRTTEAKCVDRIKVILPAIEGHSLQISSCEKIIDIAPNTFELADSALQPDWVIIQIKDSFPERVSAMDHAGIPDNEALFTYVPLQKPNSDKTEITKITCRSIQGSIRLPDYNHDSSPIARLLCDHEITKGFSGSLLYRNDDKDGKPVAVLSHIWDKQINQEDILVSKHIIASNLACLPQEGVELPKACAFNPKRRRRLQMLLVRSAIQQAQEKVEEELTAFRDNAEHPIAWAALEVKEKDQLPESYQEAIKRFQTAANNIFPRRQIPHFFKLLSPYYMQCLKKDQIPEDNKIITGVAPAIEAFVLRNEQDQIYVEHKIHMRNYEVVKSRDHEDQYFLKFKSQLPALGTPENRILSGRFTHSGHLISVCP